ncbi:glycosyl transferase [Streptomyces sulfonofaciens]|uniref:Glycosyl transferase n=1 Tax=Streptomyces sulfonofaciens TaxID=68272 RepID=A0A919G7Y5_9ACTN|nr:nucleotide disphospho-sugar-binding domain-containing protein [Streptomyces sulfonofaciens]GHH78960.1 glycosyl transferase [Streptomyces sulfonofaciens]
MRALFIPAAAAGHYFPMVPLAWALRTAGHDVCIAGQPPVTDLVVRSGLTTAVVGGSYDLMAAIADADREIRDRLGRNPASFAELGRMDPDLRKWHGGLRTAPHTRAAEAMADELVAFVRGWRPDVVVSDPITMVAPLVCEVASVPLVHHMWGPQEPSLTNFAGYGGPVERWPAGLTALYERFGAEVRADYSPFSISACPPSLQTAAVPTRHTTRYVPYNGSGVLPGWLTQPAGRPRVCVSWSTSQALVRTGGRHPVSAIAEALGALDVELVVAVTAADRDAVGALPAGTRVMTDLPLGAVLPTCAVSVNTGGAGSILTAAALGVPQVIAPQGPGHAFNAERIAAVGAGIGLGAHPSEITRPGPLAELTGSVAALLTEERWAEAAGDLRRENLAQPPLSDAVRRVEELVRTTNAAPPRRNGKVTVPGSAPYATARDTEAP